MTSSAGRADPLRAVARNYRFTMDLLRRCYAGGGSPQRAFGRVQAIHAVAEASPARVAVLEATEMGVPLYAAMGFTTAGAVTVFSPADDAPASPAATR